MSHDPVVIDPRYNGPPASANGGYAAGRLAACIDGPAEVTLRSPPPLATPLTVVDDGEVGVRLMDGERLIAEARPVRPDPPGLPYPGWTAAVEAAARSFPPETHPLPTCFVCGPGRPAGDGLDLRVGPLDPADTGWKGPLAVPWMPAADLADADGLVRPEFVWAALDCPTGHAAGTGAGMRHVLLGRQAVAIRRRPRASERCVVVARLVGRDGRKYFSVGELFGEDGDRLAAGRSTWIEVAPEVLTGAA